MKNVKKKAIAVLGATIILGTSVFTTVTADGTNVVGKIANLIIYNNGITMNLPADQKPILVNNRTYLPVRALGEALGKQIDWYPHDPNNVYISDGVNQQQYTQLVLELSQTKVKNAEKDSKIKDLEAKVKSLEDELDKKTTSKTLTNLENEINKYYGNYGKVRLSVTLSEKSNKVIVDITINKNYYSEWDRLSTSEQERLISDIVYDIQKGYKYPSIDGYLNADTKSSSYDFYTDSKDKIIIGSRSGTGSSNWGNYSSLERSIISDYSDVHDIDITESNYDIIAKVELKYAYNRYDLSEINNLRTYIAYDIDRDLNRSTNYRIYVDFYYNGSLVNSN